MKFIRDIRDEPEPPKPPNPRRIRFNATFVFGFALMANAVGRGVFAVGPNDPSPLAVGIFAWVIVLPILLAIDLVAHWRLLRKLDALLFAPEIRLSLSSPSDFRETFHSSRANKSFP